MSTRVLGRRVLGCLLAVLCAWPQTLAAYSVLSHETVIDAAWKTDLRPLLQERFPQATPDDLRKAHAYAYGGAIIQDLGYYPYGSKLFSDLTHYVRCGDFVQSLLRNAHDLNEYAFALGALAHYAGDNDGHRLAVNQAVPLLYPKLKKKFGHTVTYEQNPADHLKTEFGFDVVEVAQQRFAPDAYHDFIGFEVATPLLERAFRETYGLELSSVLTNESRAIGSYRHTISTLIPKATRVAWALKKDEIQRDLPGMTRQHFLYNLSRASYQKNWGKDYRAPSPVEKFFAFLLRLVPKVGPLKALSLRAPTPAAQQMFEHSFNETLALYRRLLTDFDHGELVLINDNLDVGSVTARGQYRLADEAYAKLLHELAASDFAGTSAELKSDILSFYSGPGTTVSPRERKETKKDQDKIRIDLEHLRNAQPTRASGTAR
jgi:Zinc dependent phospholipase C